MFGITEALGALTGIIGGITTGIMNYKMKKLELEDKKDKRAHERAMVELQTKAMIAEKEANIKITETLVEGQEKIIEAQAYLESQRSETKSKLFSEKFIDRLFSVEGKLGYLAKGIGVFIAVLFAFVDVLRALIRPGITIYQAIITTWFAYRAWEVMQSISGITPDQATIIFMRVMDTCIYLTVSCFTWWFADRNLMKHLMARWEHEQKKQ